MAGGMYWAVLESWEEMGVSTLGQEHRRSSLNG